ncbi:MAG: M16 family metallopeptidase [Muribaculaceae bacterium]
MSALDRRVAPPVAMVADIHLPEKQCETLANGVELTWLRSGNQPLVRLTLQWEGGSLDMPRPWLIGTAFDAAKEGAGDLSGAQIADAVDFNGARLSKRVSDHFSGLELLVLKDRLPVMLTVLSSIISKPHFDEDAIRRILSRAAARQATKLAKVAYLAGIEVNKNLYGEQHPMAYIPKPLQITDTDSDAIADAYRLSVGAGRLHAFLAGDVTDEVLAEVRNFLAQLPVAQAVSPIKIVPFAPQQPSRTSIDMPDALQAAVAMGLPTIPRSHPDYIKLRMSIIALGGYFSSRLMKNIREDKGLTYGIQSVLLGTHEGASIRIVAQCDKAYVDQVINETCNEIRGMVANPPAGDELNRLKLNVWTSLAAITDSPFSIMDHYIADMQVGTGADYFARQLAAVESINSQEIADLVSRYIDPEQFSIAVCGA